MKVGEERREGERRGRKGERRKRGGDEEERGMKRRGKREVDGEKD